MANNIQLISADVRHPRAAFLEPLCELREHRQWQSIMEISDGNFLTLLVRGGFSRNEIQLWFLESLLYGIPITSTVPYV